MQRILLAALLICLAVNSAAGVNVLVLCGNTNQLEFPVLENFTDVSGEKLAYDQTQDRNLPGLENANILWIGQGEICEGSYLFSCYLYPIHDSPLPRSSTLYLVPDT